MLSHLCCATKSGNCVIPSQALIVFLRVESRREPLRPGSELGGIRFVKLSAEFGIEDAYELVDLVIGEHQRIDACL